MLIEGTLTDFSDALASKSPTPGGGGAAGVAGALAAACGSMVANLLDGKARVADHQSDIERIAARLEELKRDLLSVVDEDAHAFEPVAEALALPRDTPEQTAVRVRRMQSALEDACQPPFKCMNLALDVLKTLDELCGYANRLVISDVGVGAELKVIAAVVIGGASLMGGKGGVVNTLLGALVMGIIANIMNLAGVPGYHQQVYMGAIIVVAMLLQYGTGQLKR